MNSVAFRVDASRNIGLGHAMRCLALADRLRELGWQTRFVSRHMPETFRSILRESQHEFSPLPAGKEVAKEMGEDMLYSSWLGTSQEVDAQETVSSLSDRAWDWVVADHYALGAPWESAVRRCSARILVVDDMADRRHDCDALLDQNLFADVESRYDGRVPRDCRLLLGPRYALLRKEFPEVRKSVARRDGQVRRILILMGGVDADNQTEKAVAAVALAKRSDLDVDVVVGAEHPQIERVKNSCEVHGFRFHVQARNVAALMASADLAIGGGGSTSWERCCMGLPAICVTLADNQAPIAHELARVGAIINLGAASEVSESELSHVLSVLMANPDRLVALSATSLGLVDGKGVHRACELMCDAI
jgi:UDP-2,4-diacetamido-2,4,6-trideoxy-beta-L-altropyranose hydrolase